MLCAAVTELLRTFARVVEAREEIGWKGSADVPGTFDLEISSCPEYLSSWLEGITDFVMTGLTDLKNDYPEKIRVTEN